MPGGIGMLMWFWVSYSKLNGVLWGGTKCWMNVVSWVVGGSVSWVVIMFGGVGGQMRLGKVYLSSFVDSLLDTLVASRSIRPGMLSPSLSYSFGSSILVVWFVLFTGRSLVLVSLGWTLGAEVWAFFLFLLVVVSLRLGFVRFLLARGEKGFLVAKVCVVAG